MKTILETLLNYFCTLLIISAFILMTGCTGSRGWTAAVTIHPISSTDKNEGFQAPDTIPVALRGTDRGAIQKARY